MARGDDVHLRRDIETVRAADRWVARAAAQGNETPPAMLLHKIESLRQRLLGIRARLLSYEHYDELHRRTLSVARARRSRGTRRFCACTSRRGLSPAGVMYVEWHRARIAYEKTLAISNRGRARAERTRVLIEQSQRLIAQSR